MRQFELFLELNGFSLAADDGQCVNIILSLASDAFSEDDLAEWIRRHLKPAWYSGLVGRNGANRMGLYDRYLLPPLLSAAMGAKPITYQRRKVVPRAEGRVLEIGFGAGHNLPFYDSTKVTHLWALEPSQEMRARAADRLAASPLEIEFLDLPGETIPLDSEAVDTVLVTYTLCTIPDVMKALGEMRRVMKPEGRMIFCEHGEAPDESVRRWQKRLTPVWKAIGGGCHPGRPIPKLIRDAGFRVDGLETMYLPGTPRFAGFNYWGMAAKA